MTARIPAHRLVRAAAVLLLGTAAFWGTSRPAAACVTIPGGGDRKPSHTLRAPAGAPSQGSSAGLELVSHLPIPHSTDEVVSDVWKLGDTVLVGYRCGGDGSTIIDASDPADPRIVAWTDDLPNLFTDDVTALTMDGPAWSGDLFIEPFDNCGATSAPARTRFWDIGDPARPRLLSELVTYSGVHNAYPVQRPDGTFLLLALPRGDTASMGVRGGFGIADITDPRSPRLVGVFNLREELGDVPGTDFLHDVWADEAGQIAYLSWWDAGMIRLDISDPENPRLLDRLDYYANREWYGPAAGNTHTAVPSSDGRHVYLADEDFSPGRTQIDQGRKDTLDPSPDPVSRDERGPDQSQDVWGFTRIVDLEAPGGPALIAAITTTNTALIPPVDSGWYSVHNIYEWGGRLFLSHYSDGIRMLDVTHMDAPVETGYFVPPDLPDRRGRPMKTLVWGVYVDDGYVYASDISHGLWILAIPGEVPTPTAAATGTEPISATLTPVATAIPSETEPPTTEPPTTEPPTTDPPSPTATDAELTPQPPPSAVPTGLPEPPTPEPSAEPPTSEPSPELPTAEVPTPTEPPASQSPTPNDDHSSLRRVVHLPLLVTTGSAPAAGSGASAATASKGPGGREGPLPGNDQLTDLDVASGQEIVMAGTQPFRSVRVRDGGRVRVEPYAGPGSDGGTLILRAAETIVVEAGGTISADGSGFRGRTEANGEGPGGGQGGNAALASDGLGGEAPLHFTGAGAGGGFGGRAGDGMLDKPRGQWLGGRPYGDESAFQPEWGSAGGAPPRSHHETQSLPGGNGGGALVLEAPAILIAGSLTADGGEGAHAEYDSAGGGSGGSVLIRATDLTITGRVSASGAPGGKGWEVGGAGGGGRIKIEHARGEVTPNVLLAGAGQGPCPAEEAPSPYACPGSVHIGRLPLPVYLPAVSRAGCARSPAIALAVVIDASHSMAAAGPDGSTPLQRSLDAADSLLSALTTSDRAALVRFDGTAHVMADLGAPATAAARLSDVVPGPGSRLDRGVVEGARLLAGARAGEVARLVVLSDGADSESDLDAAVAAGTAAHALVYAVGYGNPAHPESLEYVAGTSARVWIEPAPTDAAGLPSRMRADAGCPWAP